MSPSRRLGTSKKAQGRGWSVLWIGMNAHRTICISRLQGFTGSWWHSLECGTGTTEYVRVKYHSHDAWLLKVTQVRPDGTLALIDDTMVAGDHPYVERRDFNHCD